MNSQSAKGGTKSKNHVLPSQFSAKRITKIQFDHAKQTRKGLQRREGKDQIDSMESPERPL